MRYKQIEHNSPLFPHMVSYAKFILMAVGGECRSVIFILSFPEGSAGHTWTLEML